MVHVVWPESSDAVEVRPSEHGLGVFAKHALPSKSFVGVYPGKVYQNDEFEANANKMTDTVREHKEAYLVNFFKLQKDGQVDEDWVLDPTTSQGMLDPKFTDGAVTPFVNEPAPLRTRRRVDGYRRVTPRKANPNLMWVYNR